MSKVEVEIPQESRILHLKFHGLLKKKKQKNRRFYCSDFLLGKNFPSLSGWHRRWQEKRGSESLLICDVIDSFFF